MPPLVVEQGVGRLCRHTQYGCRGRIRGPQRLVVKLSTWCIRSANNVITGLVGCLGLDVCLSSVGFRVLFFRLFLVGDVPAGCACRVVFFACTAVVVRSGRWSLGSGDKQVAGRRAQRDTHPASLQLETKRKKEERKKGRVWLNHTWLHNN